MRRPRFYVSQFGGFWSFSHAEIVALFKAAAANDGCYELPVNRQLRGKPAGIHPDETGGYWSSLRGDSGRFYQPLDWTADDFEHALKELDPPEDAS